jgi:transglutaminase-like putative cysteine protease
MNFRFPLLATFLLTIAFLRAQTPYPEINGEIEAGNFTEAQKMIRDRIAFGGLSEQEAYDLALQSDLLDRIRLDFNRDEAYVRERLGKYYPELTDAQLAAWEKTNELEMRVIDGQKRYFRNAVWNLFRINKEAGMRKAEVDGVAESKLDKFLQQYLPGVVEKCRETGRSLVDPKRIRIRYTLKVKPNAVPDGETVRAWLPYPRADRDRLMDVVLKQQSETHFIISPLSYPHTSIYMEKKAVKDEWTVFSYEAEYTAWNEWRDLDGQDILPYDTGSELYKTFTAERNSHIIFTPEIKKLSARIIGDETHPLQKARLIFQWIGENVPWASALEYSTMPDIPSYCIVNKSGDCGMKALLFITLCRYNGIPAKWQSGWFLYPGSINLHDWAEVYFEGPGWVPVDPDFNMQDVEDPAAREFFFGGADAYRLIVNDDYSGDFFPAKVHFRSETVDFQRGEVEWKGGNLYFNRWEYDMEVEYVE